MGKGKKIKKTKKTSSTSNKSTSSVRIGISADDTEEMITEQWHHFKNIFENNDSVLVFHLKNHYAPIYATREWSINNQITGELEIYREILTARRGQRPTAWINFNEVRSIILSWEGYKILGLSRKSSKVDVIQTLQTLKQKLLQYQENMIHEGEEEIMR